MAHQVPLKNVKIRSGVTFQVSEDLVCSCVIHSSCRVFKGTFEGESVAVKKLPLNCTDNIGPRDEQHWDKLTRLIDNHDHVVQYRLYGVQDNIRYLVMQLCQGSLLDYCRGTLDESVASHVKATDVMWQIICGVDYLHCQKVDYGNLELKNVLFWKNDPKSRRVVVKLAGSYGCNKDNNAELFQLGCLFYSAATKREAEPIAGSISLESLTEIEDANHRSLALNLINLLIDASPNRLEINTLLLHPLFTQCNEDAQSRLTNQVIGKEIGQVWRRDKQNLQKWKSNLDQTKFLDDEFIKLGEVIQTYNDTSKIAREAFKTTPQLFSEYIWHLATFSKTVSSNENQQTQQPIKMPQVLGKGTYGIVIKRDYTDRKGNRYPAAFKTCNRDYTTDMEKFDQEIETLRELKHLFVVKYIDVVVENDTEKYIVMELCEGSVKDYVEGKLEGIPKDSLDEKILVGQVALGLAYIHDKGIIHKDLKLANILLKRHSSRLVVAKMADFGFAKELKPGKTEFSETERPGTETYMAPELLNAPDGAYPASFASDVYALGITIARIVLKGEHPYSSNKLRRQISMYEGLVPPNLQGLSWDLIDLILKLTEKDPGKRPDMVLVLRHPYFVLTNDKTKKHFVDQLWNGLQSLSPEDRSKQVKKIFSNRNFQQWYHNISGDKPATKEEMEKMAHTLPHYKTLNPDSSGSDAKAEPFTPAKKYEEAIKEAITSEYDPEVGNQINQMSLISSLRGRSCGLSRCRLYKLIQRSPKLLVPYFWSHLLDVVNESVAVDPQTGVLMTPTKAKHNSAQSKHKIIPELEWSSLYYDNEQVVDDLWNIKYSENYADSQKTIEDIIGTIAKCNVSESAWSDLLDKIGSQRGISLLSAIVESHSSNVVDFVEIFLQRFDVANLPARIHILVASNEGDFAADIMQVLLNHGLDSKKAVSKLGMTPVHYAAQNESSSGPKLMKLLLKNGGDANRRSTTHDKSTPIQLAASNQGEYAAEIFKLLLDGRCACDELSAGQFEPIHFATMNSGESAPELLDLLLKKRGVSVVNRVTGMSLVHFTMFNNGDGGPIIAKKLFENGAKPNALDKRKQTPLHLAARDTVGEKNQIAIMTVFLQNGGDPNAVDELGRTPVHYAAANEGEYALEKLKLLKDYRGNLAARDKGGLTPVHYTILNKGASGVEMRQLVGYKKGTNIPLNNCGETLLHRLVNGIHNQIHLVQTALESGVNPNVKDIFGCSPVHDAVTEIESGVGLDILKLLLQNGGDPNLPDDKNQQTPVHYAAYSLKEWGPKQTEILLSNGGNANAIGTMGYTPLHLAAMNKGNYAPKLASLLLKSNGNANAVDNCGRSPVHVAVLNENDDTRNQIIKQLLENGGNANARDKDGRAPLYYAIAEKPTNSLLKNVLIKYGGNMAERDNHGMTPNRLLMTRMRR